MCAVLFFFVIIVGILKYWKSDNSTIAHIMNYTIWIVTAHPLFRLFWGGGWLFVCVWGFFSFYSIASATCGFVNSPLCSEKEGLKPHLLFFGVLLRCFFVCFDPLIS